VAAAIDTQHHDQRPPGFLGGSTFFCAGHVSQFRPRVKLAKGKAEEEFEKSQSTNEIRLQSNGASAADDDKNLLGRKKTK